VIKVSKVPDLEVTRTDEELVDMILAGQDEVFAELYDRFYTRTYRLTYGMVGQHALAEDITQEIFMRAYQKLGKYDRHSKFSTWFYRLAVNLCLNFRKRERGRPLATSDNLDMLPLWGADLQVEAKILERQVQNHIHRALLSLKPKLRMIVILKDVDGLDYQEIAERMKCSKGTVASRLSRARQLLARKLGHLRGTF
jgi:RNA polymerase sigma-70 factor, ECF subfamily